MNEREYDEECSPSSTTKMKRMMPPSSTTKRELTEGSIIDLIGCINKSLADLDGTMAIRTGESLLRKAECDSNSVKVAESSPVTRELRIIRDRIDRMTDRLKDVIEVATLISS